MTTMKLHAALIWGGEPIADVILDKPGPITIGPVAGTTFTVPDLGLPEVFAIVSPGERGYLLTMGNEMAGTVSVGGVRKQVTDMVGAAPFAATPVSAGDWGVVDLDGGGALQLFFQVAPITEAVPPRRALDLDTLLPAAAFSVILHVLLLIATFGLSTGETAFAWPGSRALTGNYLIQRIELPPTTPPPVAPLVVPASADKPAADTQPELPKKAPVIGKGREGATGGPRVKNDAPDQVSAAQTALNSPANRKLLARLTNSPVDMTKWSEKIGPGNGRVGDDPGVGGDELPTGTPDGDDSGHGLKRQGDLDTETGAHDGKGHCKKGEKCSRGNGDGPPGNNVGPEVLLPPRDQIVLDRDTTLDPAEIQRRIELRKGRFRACYQQEYNRNQTLGGSIETRFVIAPDGRVSSVTIENASLKSDSVKACVKRQLMGIQFPTSDSGGIVRYPFFFNGGA